MRITRLGKIVTAAVIPTVAAATLLVFTAPDGPLTALNVVSVPDDATPTPSVQLDETSPAPSPTPTASPTAAEQRAARQSAAGSPTPRAPGRTSPSGAPSVSPTPGPAPEPSPSSGSNPVEDLTDGIF